LAQRAELPAELLRPFEQNHAMATARRHPRRFEARDTAAHHHDTPGVRGWADLGQLCLPADCRVLDARDGLPLDASAETGLARPRADADLVDPTRRGLPW